jgi:hypothetical protein
VRAVFQLILLGALATPAGAQALQIFGYAGVLGEWEVTASVTEKVSNRTKQFSGPLTLKHVGICTQDGPEEKTGEIRFQISESASRMRATLLVDGTECSYNGQLSDSYTGKLICPGRPAVPLAVWLK